MKAAFLLFAFFVGSLVAVAWRPGNAVASSCGDFRQQVDLSERFYREWQVYRNESESDLADAEQKNLKHSLDLATLDLGGCGDESALLRYYRVKLLLEIDGETLAWAEIGGAAQHNFGRYYAQLQSDFGHANALGLRKIFPTDYKVIRTAITAQSPSAKAQVAKSIAHEDAVYTEQAQQDLAALKSRSGSEWQSVQSVSIEGGGTFTYVVANESWQSLGEMGQADLQNRLKTLAEESYERSHCGNTPHLGITVNIVDEAGTSLDTEFPSPDPTPFMQTPTPCSE